ISFSQANKFLRKAMRTDSLNEKIELLSKVIELEPKNFDAYFYRANAKNDLGDYHDAIMDYTKIIIYKPSAEIYYNRGNSKFNLQDFYGAKEDYEEALKLEPEFIDARFNLASAKYYLNDFKGSILDLTKIIEVAPNHSSVYLQRADAFLAIEEPLFALKDLTLAILVNPSAEIYFRRGLVYLSINYYRNAKNDFYSSINIDPNNTPVYFYRGTSYLLLGKYKKALSDFSEPLKYYSLDYEALLGLALTYYKMNDMENAKINFDKAIRIIDPKNINDINIELFSETYWYKEQLFFFRDNFEGLSKL
ncbi:MAG TPA: tetratricopeptide repeat protein, partial [Flavobacteriaceae bacterium]|nr:tetratricopeptide repeat protein [Flavobacteriaceae bacterium]